MTIDEAIKHARNIAKEQRYYANFEKGMMHSVCINTAENHEQLAEWLEELKAIRQWKADVMEDFCRYDVNSFEELINNTRKKTIDEFVNFVNECSGYTENCIEHNLCLTVYTIHQIAEQLKAGGKDE